MADPYVREVGRVEDMDGAPLIVGVDYDTVTVGFRGGLRDRCLTQDQAEEFARLFVSACWQAGQQRARMAEVVDAEVWCGSVEVCANGPQSHLSSDTCRVLGMPLVAEPEGCICGRTAAVCAQAGREAGGG